MKYRTNILIKDLKNSVILQPGEKFQLESIDVNSVFSKPNIAIVSDKEGNKMEIPMEIFLNKDFIIKID